MDDYNFDHFVEAQDLFYDKALSEIKNGKKETHWMWFVFPQLKGLGQSEVSYRYGITDLDEARAYLDHPILGERLIEISQVLLDIEEESAFEIFGNPDCLKLQSSMTLFFQANPEMEVFELVLEKFYNGMIDDVTLMML